MTIHRGPRRFQDAFGRWALEALEGDDVGAVIERDDGYIEAEWGEKVYFAGSRQWTRAEREAIGLAKVYSIRLCWPARPCRTSA
ncbi:MAG: hypothetical protein HY748_17145 [Elusimicrobia bacterium]|nr:hypothetical protein [Elusimicrobiota bacterium]